MVWFIIGFLILYMFSPKNKRRSGSGRKKSTKIRGKNISPGLHRRNGNLYNTTYSGNKVRSYNVSTGKMTVRKKRK